MKNKNYWTAEHSQLIQEYNQSTDERRKNEIFKKLMTKFNIIIHHHIRKKYISDNHRKEIEQYCYFKLVQSLHYIKDEVTTLAYVSRIIHSSILDLKRLKIIRFDEVQTDFNDEKELEEQGQSSLIPSIIYENQTLIIEDIIAAIRQKIYNKNLEKNKVIKLLLKYFEEKIYLKSSFYEYCIENGSAYGSLYYPLSQLNINVKMIDEIFGKDNENIYEKKIKK